MSTYQLAKSPTEERPTQDHLTPLRNNISLRIMNSKHKDGKENMLILFVCVLIATVWASRTPERSTRSHGPDTPLRACLVALRRQSHLTLTLCPRTSQDHPALPHPSQTHQTQFFAIPPRVLRARKFDSIPKYLRIGKSLRKTYWEDKLLCMGHTPYQAKTLRMK